jgi:hypothetical protein
MGRVERRTDSTGAETRFGYPDLGQVPNAMLRNSSGFEIQRDDGGRVSGIKTSWGEEQTWLYNSDGLLSRIEMKRDGASGAVELDGKGRPVKQVDFQCH